MEGRLAQVFPGRDWPTRILRACEKYNDLVNSSTGLKPNDVTVENANGVFGRLYRPFAGAWNLEKILPLGTPVRLRMENRGQFTKTNVPRNSREIFVVGKIRLHPTGVKYKLFTLEGKLPIAGTWNVSEIVPIKLPQA